MTSIAVTYSSSSNNIATVLSARNNLASFYVLALGSLGVEELIDHYLLGFEHRVIRPEF